MHGLNGNDFILKESNPFIIRINKYNTETILIPGQPVFKQMGIYCFSEIP